MKEGQRENLGYVFHERAHQRALEIRDKKMEGRRMKDFVGSEPYTKEAIDSIETRVDKIESEMQQQILGFGEEFGNKHEMSKKLATCLEGVILNVKTWFGPTSRIYPTTRWDDYTNGVDLVAERMSGDIIKHHGFALDITYAGYNTILHKVKRISDNLKQGKLGKVDFFKTDDGRFKGQLGQIPLVIVGADSITMKELVNLFAEKEDQKIEDHQVQFQIVEQVLIQCDFFIKMAEDLEDKEISERVISSYQTLKKDFELIRNLSHRLATNRDRGERDLFHSNLKTVLENLNQ